MVRRSRSPAANGARAGSTKGSRPTSSTSGASTRRGATTPTSSCSPNRQLSGRGRGALSPNDRAGNTTSRSISSITHLYEKGGRVLHMLRHVLGDEAFWRALGHYPRKHARGSWSRVTSRAPSRRRRGVRSRSCSTAGWPDPAIPSSSAAGAGTTTASWGRCGSRRSKRTARTRRRSSSRRWCGSRWRGASRTSA